MNIKVIILKDKSLIIIIGLNILIIGQVLKIASDSIFDPDIFADPVIGMHQI